MPRYLVTVRYEMERELAVTARDESEAAERAEEIVSRWDGVISAEAGDVEEE